MLLASRVLLQDLGAEDFGLYNLVGSYWLPWVGAISTLLLSIVGASALKTFPLTKHLV